MLVGVIDDAYNPSQNCTGKGSVFTNVDSLECISKAELKFQAKLTFALQ